MVMKKDTLTESLSKKLKEDKPLYPIRVAAELIGTSIQTLRLYEKHNLIQPARRHRKRYYSYNDIKWIECLRDLIHNKKISIEGIKKLLKYASCWELAECSHERREHCSAHIERTTPCWKLNRLICKGKSGKTCADCLVLLSEI